MTSTKKKTSISKNSTRKARPPARELDNREIYKQSSKVLVKTAPDDTLQLVLIDNFRFFFSVDRWAAKYWRLVNGHRSQAEIAHTIAQLSELDPDYVKKNIRSVTRELLKNRLLEKVSRRDR